MMKKNKIDRRKEEKIKEQKKMKDTNEGIAFGIFV